MPRSYGAPRCPSTSTPPPRWPRARCCPATPGARSRSPSCCSSEPKMFNHNRGLWGYTGIGRRRRAADDPEHRHGRAERGDRARGAVRPRPRSARSASARAARWTRDLALGDLVIADAALAVRRREPRARRGRPRRRRRGLVAALRDGRRRDGARIGAVASTRPLLRPRRRARPRVGARQARSRSRWRPRAAARRRAARDPRRLPARGQRRLRRRRRAPADRRRRARCRPAERLGRVGAARSALAAPDRARRPASRRPSAAPGAAGPASAPPGSASRRAPQLAA